MKIKANDFANKAVDIAKHYKTLYVYGCFGAPMNSKNKTRYENNNEYNKARASKIEACDSNTFGFDCCGFIKGILWGWDGNKNKTYGGATYKSNDVPDVGAYALMHSYCNNQSKDFKNIKVGEVVWMAAPKGSTDSHIGIYIGDGQVAESSPKWNDGVQITNVANLGYIGGHSRTWDLHGELQFVDYSEVLMSTTQYHTVQRGDSLSKIAKKYGITLAEIKKLNPNVKAPFYIIRIGQEIRIK